MSLTPQWLDELRARTTLSTLIGRTVKLQKAGREYRACCPFHQEKSPSFYVNDEKGFYHCFGCSAHGDAIKYLTEAQGLPFMDAVKELAAAAGMEVPANDPRAAERQARAVGLHDVMAAAAAWFTDQLATPEAAHARAYLTKRGVTPAQAKAFGFGFAPDGRNRLKAALASFGVPLLVEAGLLIQVEDKDPYDRFRGRLMIPIRDARGRPIAFGGRILGDGEPKYLNSPETPLFDKGRTLFNIDRASAAARKADRVLVVEGYMDVVALDRAGIAEGVAPLGTALTESQMERLWKMNDVPILCFDGDAAGQKAALRAANRAYAMLIPGRSVSFARLPAGKDPDDLIAEGGRESIEALLQKPTTLIDLIWEAETASADMSNPDARASVKHKLEQFAETCSNQTISSEYKRSFRDLFYENFGWKRAERTTIAGAVIKTRPQKSQPILHMLIRAMLLGLSRRPKLIAEISETLAQIRIADPEMVKWREVIVNAAIIRPDLDSDALEAILETHKLSLRQREWLQRELMHAFMRPGTPEEFALFQLTELVESLSQGQIIADEMARLDERLIADVSAANYEAVESARRRLRDAEAALRERGLSVGERD